MKSTVITLQRFGGWAPLAQSAVVNVGNLPPQERNEIANLIEGIDLSTISSGTTDQPVRDGTYFILEIEAGGKSHHWEFCDRNIPGTLIKLVALLAKRLRASAPQ